jgi:hypothetical protein
MKHFPKRAPYNWKVTRFNWIFNTSAGLFAATALCPARPLTLSANSVCSRDGKVIILRPTEIIWIAALRLLFRILAFLALAVSVIGAVIDIARSMSASTLVLTSLLKGWTTVAPASLAFVQTFFQEKMPAFFLDPGLEFLLAMPAAAVFAVIAALFYAIGAKPAKHFGRIGYQ